MRIKVVKHEQGFSLIEVLIALLVLSIGLVGMAALMLTSLKNVHSSAHYSVASAVMLDFEELLWLEMAQTVASASGPAALDADGCLSDGTIGTLAGTVTADWNAVSADSEWGWSNVERFRLPGLSFAIDSGNIGVDGVDRDGDAVNDVNWKSISATLSWDEDRFSDGDGGESYTGNITIACRPLFL